jgi:hypothetical protein
MKKLLLILFLILLFPFSNFAQENKRIVVYAKVVDGDTIPIIPLPEVSVYSFRVFKTKREARRITRLMRNVRKVYPYAKLAGIKLNEYSEILKSAKNDKERRRIMKKAEKEIKVEFGDDLRKLTFSQGKILIKLIDRETGTSSFKLVQELRGKFVAFFWQTFARLFGYNLKVQYDPKGEDRAIEIIVLMIENGAL